MTEPKNEGTKVVTVGCNLSNGLHLDLKGKDGPVRFTLKGRNAARIYGGFGITEGIPEDFMREWLKRNAKHPAVVNGSIFVHEDAASAQDIGKERREIRTGLEPIDPVRSGMLKTEGGSDDAKALKDYREAQQKNPDRNRQEAA